MLAQRRTSPAMRGAARPWSGGPSVPDHRGQLVLVVDRSFIQPTAQCAQCRQRWSPQLSDGDRSVSYSQGRMLAVVYVLSTLFGSHARLCIVFSRNDLLISAEVGKMVLNCRTHFGAGLRSLSRLNRV